MSSAAETVVDAFRALGILDMNEETCSPAEMTNGLRVLTQMIDGFAAQGMTLATQTLAATLASDSAEIADLTSTVDLSVGFNVTGTGIPVGARILSIDSAMKITLDAVATADGSAIALEFTALPFQPRYQEGVVALLALRLAGRFPIPPMVVEMARMGWINLQAGFMRVPAAQFDAMLIGMSNTTRQAAYYDGTDG